MSIIARLEQGGDFLELDRGASGTGRVGLGRAFHPPEFTENIVYGNAQDWGQTPYAKDETNLVWEVDVHIHGTKITELRRAVRDLQAFLTRAGDEINPVYFAWRAFGDYRFEPKLGTHGKFTRYEVVEGKVILGQDYYLGATHGAYLPATLRLTIKPGAFRRALAGIASGGVVEDIYGVSNGKSRGLRINPATTNYFKNPVLDHPSTWNTGWTAGANIYEDQNTDPNFYLFGESSVRLVYDGTAGGDTYLASCATGVAGVAMVISCYVKKVDGTPVSSSDFFFVRGSTSIIGMGSGSPLEVGNGWYRCWVATTSNGTSNYGVRLNNAGRYLYFDGFQLEFGSTPSFLCYGDQPGSAWSGASHNSTSSRTAGSVTYPRKTVLPSYSQGTVRLSWKPDFTAGITSSGTSFFLFTNSILNVVYDGGGNRFFASDGTNYVEYAVILGNNTIYTLHFTFNADDGLALYVDGVQQDTNATYTLPTVGASGNTLYLGTSSITTLHAGGTIMGFALFDREMTAGEVTADYAELAPLLADDERVDDIPWCWTKNGGGLIYNQNDADEGNYYIFGGFGGDVVTPEMYFKSSQAWDTIGQIHLGRLAIDQRTFSQYIPGVPAGVSGSTYNLLWRDLSGTVDATASGGEIETKSLSTTAYEFGGSIFYARQNTYFANKPVSIIGRLKDSGGGASANLRVTATYQFGGYEWEDNFKNLPALGTSNYGLVEFAQVQFPQALRVRPEGGYWYQLYAAPTVKRSTGTSNLLADYIAYLPHFLHVTGYGTSTFFLIRGKYGYNTSTDLATGADLALKGPLALAGYEMEFEGGKLNLVNAVIGTLNDSDTAAITWTLTMQECWLVIRTNGD